jgi:hypothetical protein
MIENIHKHPGDEIVISLSDPNYPEVSLRSCRVNRSPRMETSLQRSYLRKILKCMDEIDRLNEKRSKVTKNV